MGDHHNLQVWERAHHMTLEVNQVTRTFPKEELYGKTSQPRSASGSIPVNIVESTANG